MSKPHQQILVKSMSTHFLTMYIHNMLNECLFSSNLTHFSLFFLSNLFFLPMYTFLPISIPSLTHIHLTFPLTLLICLFSYLSSLPLPFLHLPFLHLSSILFLFPFFLLLHSLSPMQAIICQVPMNPELDSGNKAIVDVSILIIVFLLCQ